MPDAGADSPSLVAARAVSSKTIPSLQNTIADRFSEVGNLIEVARTQFARAEGDLTAVITSAGTLLPSGS